MSFSATVKEELTKVVSPARHCQIAELAAIFSSCGKIEKEAQGDVFLSFQTENETVVRKCFTLLKKTFNIDTEILLQKKHMLKKGNAYTVELRDPKEVMRFLQGTRFMKQIQVGLYSGVTDPAILQKNCCRRAFIRGAFLASGSISAPEKGYHFEIVCTSEEKAQQLREVIQSFSVGAKVVMRKKTFVVYVKEGSQIVDLLAVMEASRSLMNLENIRILKEVRNSINRQVNCDTANINKTVGAAVKQTQDIRLIEETMGLGSLDHGLEEIARLRLQFPEATLKELGMMLAPPVGKSGVNHRLRKIGEMAEKLRSNNKEEILL